MEVVLRCKTPGCGKGSYRSSGGATVKIGGKPVVSNNLGIRCSACGEFLSSEDVAQGEELDLMATFRKLFGDDGEGG